MKYLSVAGLITGAAFMIAAAPVAARVNVDLHVMVPGPYVAPAPVYVQPAPVYVQPAPVYVQPAPVYVQPRPVYVQPSPVYVQPRPVWGYQQQWREHDRHDHRRHRRHDQDHDGVPNRWDRDRDGDGVPNQWDQRPRNPSRY